MFGDDCSYLTKENFSKHTIESLDKSTHINKAKEFFFDTDEIYQNKDKSIYPVSHPDLSTQPSILPQRFGNLPINEILIAKGREDEIPSDAMVISAFSFNAKECCPATVKYMQPEGLSASWSITNEQGVDPEFTLIQYVGADVGYYYTNVDKNYLEFVITGRSGVISFNSSDINNILQYSKDGGSTWDTVSGDIQVFYGDRIMWKGLMSPVGPNGVGTFAGNVEYDVQGNVMSLLYGDDFIGKTSLEGKDYVFASLFGNNKLVSAKNLILPATTLSNSCYSSMFTSCTSLTEAPQLPATTLAEGCYTNMFQGCTILTTAPKLPANTLVYFCYVGMFRYCTNLNLITCLATNISADCTNQWVDGVAASGTFTKAPSMTSWPNGINGIPNGWTINNF